VRATSLLDDVTRGKSVSCVCAFGFSSYSRPVTIELQLWIYRRDPSRTQGLTYRITPLLYTAGRSDDTILTIEHLFASTRQLFVRTAPPPPRGESPAMTHRIAGRCCRHSLRAAQQRRLYSNLEPVPKKRKRCAGCGGDRCREWHGRCLLKTP
jgi:hypothetical protein